MAEVDTEKLKEQFPSNNYTEIKPREEIAKITDKQPAATPKKKHPVREKRKTFGERIAENFLNLDHEQIRERLLFDWLFPEIIATVDDILRMIFLGDRAGSSRRSRRERGRGSGYTSYNSIYDEKHRDRDYDRGDPTRQNFKHIRLIYYDRQDADSDLDEMRESLEENENGWITVKEVYSIAELPTNSTMLKWGWRDLEDAIVTRQGDDWILEMPRAEVIR